MKKSQNFQNDENESCDEKSRKLQENSSEKHDFK